jgi:nicotinamide riboside transporter PnuC
MKRPLSVTIIAWIYIAVGAVSFVYGFPLHGVHSDDLLAEIVAGIWMLRGENWARWLAIAWIVFHIGLSAFHGLREMAVHTAFGIAIAIVLFRPNAASYFSLKAES